MRRCGKRMGWRLIHRDSYCLERRGVMGNVISLRCSKMSGLKLRSQKNLLSMHHLLP
jgi:hypothetical protein